MNVADRLSRMPFSEHLGIEVLEADAGYARGRLKLDDVHSSSRERFIAHGGVTYALADTIGGAAAISATLDVTPTIDMRIDYLAPANGDLLLAEAELRRNCGTVTTVEVEITDGDGEPIAVARGTFKTGGADGETAWGTAGRRDTSSEQATRPRPDCCVALPRTAGDSSQRTRALVSASVINSTFSRPGRRDT